MKIGDIVIPKNPKEGSILCCSTHVYTHAICVSVDPFVIVSSDGDMSWSHQSQNDYISLSQVHPDILKQCIKNGLTRREKDWKVMTLWNHKHQRISIATNGELFRMRGSFITPIECNIEFAEKVAETTLHLIRDKKKDEIKIGICKECKKNIANIRYDHLCEFCYRDKIMHGLDTLLDLYINY